MDEKVREQSCRALLILGGHFSYCGEVKTLAWLLKQAGFCDSSEANLFDKDDEDMPWVHLVFLMPLLCSIYLMLF